MTVLQDCMNEFQNALQQGRIQKAYLGIIEFMQELRTHLSKKYPKGFTTGGFYQGYLDMSYFSFTPDSLKSTGLKIAIVFAYNNFRFEVWLAAGNKTIQKKYWDLFVESGWKKYHLVPEIQGYDSIMEDVLIENPDFDDRQLLVEIIEQKTISFIENIEAFFSELKQ